MSKLIGGGLPKFWQLPDNHKFQPAFVIHDAGQDAIDIFLNKKQLCDVSTQDYPIEYPLFVQTQLEKLCITFDRTFNRDSAVREFVGRIDREFKSTCLKLSKTSFDRLQVWFFFKLVKLYSKYKY